MKDSLLRARLAIALSIVHDVYLLRSTSDDAATQLFDGALKCSLRWRRWNHIAVNDQRRKWLV
jgi:hypothetical protein